MPGPPNCAKGVDRGGRTRKGVSYSIVYEFGWGQRVETRGRDSGGRKVGHGGLPIKAKGWVPLMSFSHKNNRV